MRVSEQHLRELIGEAMREPPGACADCVPQELSPIKVVHGGANWQLLSHRIPCPPGCTEKLLQTCRDLAGRYDVDWP
ncbi:MAG TPA: hypothetical protein VFA75_08765 [Nevskia sp.]|nr:hypothetical protein [Nevskia sp.]